MNDSNHAPVTRLQVQQATELLIKDLYTLHLVDGIPAHVLQKGQKVPIAYKEVRLRDTTVADQRWAVQQSERAVLVNGAYQLLTSKAEYGLALTLRHCAEFRCGEQALPQAVMDLDTFGKLSDHDLSLIEERVYLTTLAAQVRYGAIDEASYQAVMLDHVSGKQGKPSSPQPQSQVSGMAATAADPELGPVMLADFTGTSAHGAAAGLDGDATKAAA